LEGLGSIYETASEMDTTKLAIASIAVLGMAAVAKDISANGLDSASSLFNNIKDSDKLI
jgi:hypothetical protein